MSGYELNEIFGDAKTVWVNNSSGDCIARFGSLGIDIHTSVEEQLKGASQCLFCTHEKRMLTIGKYLKLRLNSYSV